MKNEKRKISFDFSFIDKLLQRILSKGVNTKLITKVCIKLIKKFQKRYVIRGINLAEKCNLFLYFRTQNLKH